MQHNKPGKEILRTQDRRIHQIFVLIERRNMKPKEVAYRMNLSYSNVRQVIHRAKRNPQLSQLFSLHLQKSPIKI